MIQPREVRRRFVRRRRRRIEQSCQSVSISSSPTNSEPPLGRSRGNEGVIVTVSDVKKVKLSLTNRDGFVGHVRISYLKKESAVGQ